MPDKMGGGPKPLGNLLQEPYANMQNWSHEACVSGRGSGERWSGRWPVHGLEGMDATLSLVLPLLSFGPAPHTPTRQAHALAEERRPHARA